MSTATAALAVLAFLVFSIPAACRKLRAAGRQTDRIIRETLEPADLAAQVDDLDAGCHRLRQAIQDHREDQP